LLAHPGVLAHGLDLTAASLIIWYAPTTSHDTYCQANARIDGSKQAVKIDIAHIYATAEERRIYSVLKEKGRLQDVVLALANNKM
jgi:Na+-transporting NADH:ubiquinone oxidoreductase subunit NqrC